MGGAYLQICPTIETKFNVLKQKNILIKYSFFIYVGLVILIIFKKSRKSPRGWVFFFCQARSDKVQKNPTPLGFFRETLIAPKLPNQFQPLSDNTRKLRSPAGYPEQHQTRNDDLILCTLNKYVAQPGYSITSLNQSLK